MNSPVNMGPITTKALVSHEVKGSLKLEEIQLDALQPNEVLVEIQATGICHTDLSCMDGVLPASFPSVFGHEGTWAVLYVFPTQLIQNGRRWGGLGCWNCGQKCSQI